MLDVIGHGGGGLAAGLQLRPYQREAIDAIPAYFEEHRGNPLVVIPTGGGKSLIIAQFIREVLEAVPDSRILVLTHVKELIGQNYAELIGLWPDAPAGIYSAGLRKRDLHSRIIFAGIQSIHKHAYKLQDPPVDLVLVDEAHLIPRASNTTYRRFLDDLLTINRATKLIGFTATPYRLDSGMLHKGEDAMFDAIAYNANLLDLIEAGYLTRPVSKSAVQQIDTSGVGTRSGEFVPGQLEAAAMHPEVVAAVADEIVAHSEGRRGILAFGCGVDHCRMLRDALRERGITCESIFGDTPAAERDSIVAAFKAQKIRALSSMGVLTTGFNARHVDLLAVARPTKSVGLWVQMVGRGTRLYPGKDDCLVLDFGGNIARHGPIDKPRVTVDRAFGGGGVPGVAPEKVCPHCQHKNPINVALCTGCGEPFPDAVTTINTAASTLGMLSVDQAKPEWIPVDSVSYRPHLSKAGNNTLRVTYICGFVQHTKYLFIKGRGRARAEAVAFWQGHAPGAPVPNTVEEAMAAIHTLAKPLRIAVRPDGQYTKVVAVDV